MASGDKAFSARQQAAILRLYVEQRLAWMEVARRLGLLPASVEEFLRQRGAMRPRGGPKGVPKKLLPPARQRLESELATTQDAVLARKYGVSRERVRLIRKQLGYPSSRFLRDALIRRARADRRKREQIERKLRRQAKRKAQGQLINRLSAFWKSGLMVAQIAKKEGLTWGALNSRLVRLRRLYPRKFPVRLRPPPRWQREQIERKLRREQKQKVERIAIQRLSKRWMAGVTIAAMAKECGLTEGCLNMRIVHWRQRHPEKFPYRLPANSRQARLDKAKVPIRI